MPSDGRGAARRRPTPGRLRYGIAGRLEGQRRASAALGGRAATRGAAGVLLGSGVNSRKAVSGATGPLGRHAPSGARRWASSASC